MGRHAVDPVRRLTLALLLAAVAALGAASGHDAPVEDEPAVTPAPAPPLAASRVRTTAVYEEWRCTEPALTLTPASLATLVRRP